MPKFQVGNPGKPKGARSKGAQVREILEEMNVDLFQEIINLMPKLNPSKRVDTYLAIAEYAYPRLKGIEMSGSVESVAPMVQIMLPSNSFELQEFSTFVPRPDDMKPAAIQVGYGSAKLSLPTNATENRFNGENEND